ncbi:hypothetical protein [Streptomyces gardneri]|uniref:Uncharacterized protein n=1 Tax=Streptomyces gardneri TaxID=66892 RepID=A0A4Y3RM60_9ACTN|nr:hypothetical protein [Streptomyces gardneri]GEB58404.1 hypothetical protein SGA01_40090 [Streptomyces gardneri]GHH03264.1 hypothetical protein GCM10017674_40710 [Streptomyces gardneri]
MRAAAVFALSAGVIVPAVIHAPAAHADWTGASGITLDDGRYRLSLPTNALWVKVSVLASTAPDAAVLASTEALTASNYNWITDAPFALPAGTAFGDYPVRVDYRLPGETTKKWTGGTYAFRPHVGVSELSWNRTTTSYDQRQAVLSGKTTLWNPATGTRTAAPQGTKVALKISTYATSTYGTINATATTREDGTFSVPVTPNGSVQGGTATVVTAGTVNDPDGEAYVPTLGVDPLVYRISADLNKFRVLAGTNVQVTGHVERYTPNGWKPFAGAPVVGTGTEPSYNDTTAVNVLGGATSSATGTFSFAAKAQYSTDFVYTSLRPSAYIQNSRSFDRSDITVPQQFSFSPYAITLDEYGTVTATGGFNGYCTVTQPVQLQASLDNGRTWRVLRSGTNSTYCGYKLTAQGYESALYRVYHPETNQFVAKGGTSLKRARTYTRFSAFSISPTRPVVNGKMTVTGTVQRKVAGVWKPLAGAKLTLIFKPQGENQWYWVTKSITTDSSGRFSYRATAYKDGSWATYLNTTGSYFYSETNAKYIDAR